MSWRGKCKLLPGQLNDSHNRIMSWNESWPSGRNIIRTIKMTNRVVANATTTIPRRTITKTGTIKIKEFEWTDKCQRAFKELKAYLTSPPLFSLSKPDEKLSFYLAVSLTVVSSALIRKEDRVQLPVCYTSRTLKGEEERNPPMEKLAFALITTAGKLRPYFEAHTIIVQMNKPLSLSIS